MLSGQIWKDIEEVNVVPIGRPVTSYDVIFMNERINVKTAEEADTAAATIKFFGHFIHDAITWKGVLDKHKFELAQAQAKRARTGVIEWNDLK